MGQKLNSKTKVLFFAEGATLAHVTRPFLLAGLLDTTLFDIVLARPPTFQWLTATAPFRVLDLHCQDPAVFTNRLEHGAPLYDLETLARYVNDDLALIDREKPDVIVGDFRLSLSVSARLRSIPYITVCDAYWSPERPLSPPLPVLPLTRFAPIPFERLRKRFGLPSFDHDLRSCYTDADLRLFANFPTLFPEITPGPQAAFIGPLAWSPEPGPNFEFLNPEEPLIYVTMGSSGNPLVLKTLIPVLERTGHRIIVATAGRHISGNLASSKTQIFDFVPGDLICLHARLVVCNGGSPTTNQALSKGVPVLGIAQNMDQFLNMKTIEQFGAGILIRGDRANTQQLNTATRSLLSTPGYAKRAQELARSTHSLDYQTTLTTFISRLTQSRSK